MGVRAGARLKWLVRRVMINWQTHVLLLPLAPQVTRSGGSSREIVPMMKTAKSRHGYDFATCFGIFQSLTPGWSFLGKWEVGAVFVVVTDVLIHEASQMQFVERNHMIEQITASGVRLMDRSCGIRKKSSVSGFWTRPRNDTNSADRR